MLALLVLLTLFLRVESIKQPLSSLNFAKRSASALSSLHLSSCTTIRGGSLENGEESMNLQGANDSEDANSAEEFDSNNKGHGERKTTSELIPKSDEASGDNSGEEISSLGSNASDSFEEAPNTADGNMLDATTALAIETATNLRLEGKAYHDQGDFVKAADLFEQAADTLLANDEISARLSEEYATCRLHQALCQLKSEKYELCIDACSDVLQDGNGRDDETKSKFATFASKSTAVKSRAYHRRAKAKVGLGDTAGALQDARTAAFLGDAKAVALYGKLMRESSSSEISSALNPMLGSQPTFPSSALFESLLQKSGPSDASSLTGVNGLSPLSMLMGNGSGGNGSMLDALGSGAGGGLVKSVLKNLSKRLDEKATHEQISNFLQNANKNQLRSLASMAGLNDLLQDNQLDTLLSICHGVKPKHIRRTVRTTKVMVYLVKLIRRCFKVINKYKTVIAALLILQWTKSATFRPIPINKKAARQAAKKALKEGMKATRWMF
ncbi:hypothetical protein IV203_004386 [Nitzschia inconspicua]|uniref:Uncharacterized protein n=1 Tax=Nitzschia inconspicua TaxID=303405 RepID=A0A9K3PP90_9STRA|nr:hypothetical protein IV203_004386 [Nitzschia inconspicua]